MPMEEALWGKTAIESKIFLCRQHELWLWIEVVLNTKLPSPDLKTSLRDGVMLLELAQYIRGKLKKQRAIQNPTRSSEKKQNIKLFISWCKNLNIPPERLFVVNDLYYGENMVAVVNTLHVVAALARRRGFKPALLKVNAEEMKFPEYELKAAIKHLTRLQQIREGLIEQGHGARSSAADQSGYRIPPSPSPSPTRSRPSPAQPRRPASATPAQTSPAKPQPKPQVEQQPKATPQAKPQPKAQAPRELAAREAAPVREPSPRQEAQAMPEPEPARAAGGARAAGDPHPLSDTDDETEEKDYHVAANFPVVGTRPLKAKAIFSYKAEKENQLTFKKGDTLIVYNSSQSDGWWSAELDGEIGYIPYNYIVLMDPAESDAKGPRVRKAGPKIAKLQEELKKQGLHASAGDAAAADAATAASATHDAAALETKTSEQPKLLTDLRTERPKVNRRPPTRKPRRKV